MGHQHVRDAMGKFNNLFALRHHHRGNEHPAPISPAMTNELAEPPRNDATAAQQYITTPDLVDVETPHPTFNHVRANYEPSSHSLADTQFTQDDPKYAWSTSNNCGADAPILSGLVSHQESLYFLNAGRPVSVASDTPKIPNAEALSPPSRPEWRSHAQRSGRAGNCYTHTRDAEHLRDRLFWQSYLIDKDSALLAASHQAAQESRSIQLEIEATQQNVYHKESQLQDVQERAEIAKLRLTQLEAGNKALQNSIEHRNEQGQV